MMNITSTEFRVFNLYLLIKWLASGIVHSFFTKVTIINEERLPLYGPVILVGNHNNQFMDAAALIYALPRQISFLVAVKTLKRKLIGTLAELIGCIPVHRQDDLKYSGSGKIVWEDGSTVIRGIDTRLKTDLSPGDKLFYGAEKRAVLQVLSDTEMVIDAPIPHNCSDKVNGENFIIVPKVDLSDTYEAVSTALRYGNAIAIFPEGGSHDRTNLLPLKPGVALMALYSLMEGAEDVVVLPVGLAYTDSHVLQSSATIYYGNAITLTKADCEEFQMEGRSVVTRILGQIEDGLKHCMITASNKDIKRWIDLCGSLYPPERSLIPTNKAFELRKIIANIFWKHSENEETKKLIEQLTRYRSRLEFSYLEDDEVWLLKQSLHSATLLLIEHTIHLICCIIVGLSFSPLWLPLHGISKVLAERHRKQALKASVVKLEGADVVASYKILVLIVIVPLFNLGYGLLLGIYLYRDLKNILIVVFLLMCVLPVLYYVNLRNVRKIPRILRQLRVIPIIVMGRINVWRETERELITMRTELQLLVREFVHKMGPKVSDTFLDELSTIIPRVLIDADTTRLIRSKDIWMPIFVKNYAETREEIL